jgi:hypothetical protein
MPSKKILLLLIVSVVALGAVSFFVKKEGKVLYSTREAPLSERSTLEVDTDGDGLSDWEEVLWGLDAKNPDTDGNGVGDKEEVENMKNQTGANLPLFTKTSISSSQNNEDLSSTDIITREIFYDFLKAEAEGRVGADYLNDLSNRAANSIFSIATSYETYTLNDLKISGALSGETVLQYMNGMILALNKSSLVNQTPFSLAGIEDPEDPAFFSAVINIASYYDTLSKILQAAVVPSELANLHLSVLNGFVRMSHEFKIIASADEDPLAAMSALTRISAHQINILTATAEIDRVLNSQDVIFSEQTGFYIQKTL